jgi:CRISPR-associated protein Csb2
MFAIEVEYLMGRSVATDPSQRDRAEWPPHPTRLFSALVDALGDVSDVGARARAESALRWIEGEPPPEIAASLDEDTSFRTVVKHFVPINDETADPKNSRAAPLTELRTRQERYFPAVVPGDPRVVFAWPKSEPLAEHVMALSELAERVPYLGHSSSLVRVSCAREAPARTIGPALVGDYLLRVPGPGRLDRLNAIHDLRKTDTYAQPPRGREVPYARIGEEAAVHGPHGAMRVMAFDGTSFGLEEMAWVTARFRAALLAKLPDGRATPESLSGHGPDGKPSTRPHLAFAPLANVALTEGKFAKGSIKGLAVLLPRDLSKDALILLDTALASIEQLVFGQRGAVHVRARRETDWVGQATKGHLHSLDTRRYSKSATTWVTVTPIVLGLHPKPAKGLTEEDIVVRHLKELGLPEPIAIRLRDVSDLWGAPPARTFHRGNVRALVGRRLRHAVIRFADRIAGPLVVGAGAHAGFGLLLPKEELS